METENLTLLEQDDLCKSNWHWRDTILLVLMQSDRTFSMKNPHGEDENLLRSMCVILLSKCKNYIPMGGFEKIV